MNSDHDRRADAADDVGRLIAQAGRRPAPAALMQESVRAVVEQAWNASVSQRNFRRRSLWLSAAAAIGAVAVGLLWFGARTGSSPPPEVATFVAARGAVTFGTPGHELVVAGNQLPAGTTVQSGATGFALITVGSAEVRIGPDSSLRLEAPGRVNLEGGRLYAETAVPAAPGPSLIVDTPFGRVSHLGTQFQLVMSRASMEVGVRSGRVTVTEGDGRAQTLTRGEGLEVLQNGDARRLVMSPYGASWAWVNTLEPDFPIDGRSLAEFLSWYARETGLKLVFLGGMTAAAVDQTILSGSIVGLTPDQALAAVMATTAFKYDMTVPGELRVRMRGTASRGT